MIPSSYIEWHSAFSCLDLGFGRPSMGTPAGSRQDGSREQGSEPGLWCHGQNSGWSMGSPGLHAWEKEGASQVDLWIFWKCLGGLCLKKLFPSPHQSTPENVFFLQIDIVVSSRNGRITKTYTFNF